MTSPTLGKQGLFDHQTLTVTFGGAMSKPQNKFTAKAYHVTPFTYVTYEKESLGNGWYGQNREKVTHNIRNLYVITRDNKVIGVMHSVPRPESPGYKDSLVPIDQCGKFQLEHIRQCIIKNQLEL